jgi:threonine dehydrogenase-like Zn-dependent dehydrogenase
MVGSNHNPCSRLYPEAVELLKGGEVPAGLLITHRFPLERIEEAFAFTTTARGEVVKVMITQGEGDG